MTRHHGENATTEFITGGNKIGVTDAQNFKSSRTSRGPKGTAFNSGLKWVPASSVGRPRSWQSPYYFGLILWGHDREAIATHSQY